MTTREALAAMKDRGDFESLATAILRVIEPDCAALIHHGVNAPGEPIPAPVDAWCLVPGSNPPRFVLVQHTTTDRKKLREKWLGQKDGDLAKVAAETVKLRAKFPTADFRLFLTTNLVPTPKLQTDVYKSATDVGLKAVIVEQSRLSDYLDKPEGQLLRRNFLKIDADSLSKGLLAELSRKSAQLHAQRFLSGETMLRIERETDRQLKVVLRDPTIALHCLVADPGFGKSTTAQHILSEHVTDGGYGLWIPESILATAASVEDAINRTLYALYPALSLETAAAWPVVCAGKRLLIVIDDINHAPDRDGLLRKLEGWTAPIESRSAVESFHQRIVVICPIWPQVWDAARDPNVRRTWVNMTSFGPMESTEAAAVVAKLATSNGRHLTDEEARECAEGLNRDPYFLGIFGELLRDAPSDADPRRLTHDVIKQYADNFLVKAAFRSGAEFTTADLRAALAAIATQMLLQKDLHPQWLRMRAWLKESFQSPVPEAAEFLRRDAIICRVVEGDRLAFRHDRLMQHLLAESMFGLLDSEQVTGEVFYAEVMGQTLATTVIGKEMLAKIAELNPLALFEAIRVMGTASTPTHRSVVEATIDWLRRPGMPDQAAEALMFAVGLALMETDSPAVAEITRYLRPDHVVLAAGVRNGSAWAGVCFFGEIARGVFEPGIRNTWRDRVLTYAFQNHRQKLVTELYEILERSDLTHKQSLGALLLAGYLTDSELASGIVSCCKRALTYEHLLAEAVWAAGRCCSEQIPACLDPLFDLLQDVSGEKSGRDWSLRDGIGRAFSSFPANAFNPTVVAYIVRKADEQPKLQDVLFSLVHVLDTPDALEHLARHKAAQVKTKGKDEVTSFDFVFSRWGPHRSNSVRPSENSRSRLRDVWQSEREDQVVRSAAFRIWSWSADTADLAPLRTVCSESPLFDSALWCRAELGDRDCIPELARCLRENGWLANVAHHVWSTELASVVDGWLTRFANRTVENPHLVADCFAHLLTRIPVADGERLLEKHWRGLREQHDFVQAALLISSETTIELADEAIRAKRVENPFAHIETRMNDLRQKVPGWSVSRFLRNLERYLDLLPPDALWHFTLNCRWAGEADWCRKHIMPRLSDEERRRHFADDVAIANELHAVANDEHRWRYSKFAFDALLRNEADPRRIIDLAAAAFDSAPSFRRYTILAESVAELGGRSDFPLLDRPFQKEWAEAAQSIRINTEFRVCRRTLA